VLLLRRLHNRQKIFPGVNHRRARGPEGSEGNVSRVSLGDSRIRILGSGGFELLLKVTAIFGKERR